MISVNCCKVQWTKFKRWFIDESFQPQKEYDGVVLLMSSVCVGSWSGRWHLHGLFVRRDQTLRIISDLFVSIWNSLKSQMKSFPSRFVFVHRGATSGQVTAVGVLEATFTFSTTCLPCWSDCEFKSDPALAYVCVFSRPACFLWSKHVHGALMGGSKQPLVTCPEATPCC